MSMRAVQLLLVLLINCSDLAFGTPILTKKQNLLNKDEVESLPIPPAELFEFLRRYGYLESGPSDSEALYSEDAVVDAIKIMQQFGGLKQTGELNDETLELLIKPRCGRADILPKIRNKRFVIGGAGWRKRKVTYL